MEALPVETTVFAATRQQSRPSIFSEEEEEESVGGFSDDSFNFTDSDDEQHTDAEQGGDQDFDAAAAVLGDTANATDLSHLKTGKVFAKRKQSLNDFHHSHAKHVAKKEANMGNAGHGVFSMGPKAIKENVLHDECSFLSNCQCPDCR